MLNEQMNAEFSERQLGGRGWEVPQEPLRGSLDKVAWGKTSLLERGRRCNSFSVPQPS